MPTPEPADRTAKLVTRLMRWGEATRRDLPWRDTRDPWAVLVSELMLQQTQVARVAPRFTAFLEELPTPRACADAPVGRLVELWDGLGYNRRAVNLHRAATIMVEEHDGEIPADLDDLLALPGVGPYTARAVLAFAFEQDHGVLDTNAARFLARAVAGRALKPREAQELADELVPMGRAWAWNQAVLDLGATICTKRGPRCDDCPIGPHCSWAVSHFEPPDPAEGTAGASGPQSRFDGSDRQGRGRLVQALRTGPVDVERLADVAGWPDEPDRASRVADALVGEGIAEYADGCLSLPA
jgi:A/G-specific adenine glycosylase